VLAGIRRGLLILAAIAVPTALLSVLLGLAAGGSVQRALATGFYLVGAMLMVVGLLSGARGPFRPAPLEDAGDAETPSDAEASPLFGMGFRRRRLRTATGEERRDAVFGAVLFLVLGLVLVALGALADSEIDLF
jgi:hypothetical protein